MKDNLGPNGFPRAKSLNKSELVKRAKEICVYWEDKDPKIYNKKIEETIYEMAKKSRMAASAVIHYYETASSEFVIAGV